jgi:4-amino-4-deoxy-L-arabinose transferase-like glycosyltransferase
MARKMVDWITPMFDYGVPFWGKPPLSFWTQAASMTVFGVNEFAARFPAWLLHLASCFIIIKLGTQQISRNAGIWAAIIFSSTTLGLVSSGVVLTDPVLSFSILLASYGFWRWMKCASKADAYLMFAGLGLGLLAKGPLTLVLMGAPAFAWFVIYKEWGRVLRLPWISGLVLMFGISVPWYVAAEMKTPGFMEYFFVGEHWSRYVVSNWAGTSMVVLMPSRTAASGSSSDCRYCHGPCSYHC